MRSNPTCQHTPTRGYQGTVFNSRFVREGAYSNSPALCSSLTPPGPSRVHLPVHSEVSSAIRRKATGVDHKNRQHTSQTSKTALKTVQKILPKLEARMIEFLAEWLVTFLTPAHTRIGSEGTSSFLYVPQRILVSRTAEGHGIS